jgi:hypothetical protein
VTHGLGLSTATSAVSASAVSANRVNIPGIEWSPPFVGGVTLARPRPGVVADSVLDDVATQLVLAQTQAEPHAASEPSLPPGELATAVVGTDAVTGQDQEDSSNTAVARLAVLGAAVGFWAHRAGIFRSRKRSSARLAAAPKTPDASSKNEIS